MNILTTIVETKRKEINYKKAIVSIKLLEKSMFFTMEKNISLKNKLTNQAGIIAEFKLKSPSKQEIKAIPDGFDGRKNLLISITQQYYEAGASAFSILTDEPFFGGKLEDILIVRNLFSLPTLRKDFVIDEYQIIEAKSVGATFILLIAACLNPQETSTLAQFAHSLGLEVLLEVHTADEIATHINPFIDFVGVNNRNLQTFVTDIQTSIELAPLIPSDFIKISESGLENPDTLTALKAVGYRGFLIGETLMKANDITQTLQTFLQALK